MKVLSKKRVFECCEENISYPNVNLEMVLIENNVDRRVIIYDITENANVSISTVPRVFNNSPYPLTVAWDGLKIGRKYE